MTFAEQWRKDNDLSPNKDFGTTDDIRAGRCDEIDLCYWADYIDTLVAALEQARNLVPTARGYFPKSIRHTARFQLEQTCAAINAALAKVQS